MQPVLTLRRQQTRTMLSTFQAFWLRPRLLIALGAGVGTALLIPVSNLWTRMLSGWCLGVIVYISLIFWLTSRQSVDDLRRQASDLDDSAAVISLFAAIATLACFGAVAALVFGPQQHSTEGWLDIALAAFTLVCAWAFIQAIFTIHYAHVYYGSEADGQSRGGLEFGGDEDPDIWDFLYFTITIGATAQTSDTNVTSRRMRRIVTAQSTYSYFFNTAVLALAINMAAGLAHVG
jgi:uncharacterized membrane protein